MTALIQRSLASIVVVTLGWVVASAVQAADLKIGYAAEVSSADPHIHQLQNRNVWMHVYEPLVKQDANLRATPGLARGWRSTDPQTWVFTLRPNVVFHDGSTFDAEDVKASIERARTLSGPRTLKSYLKDIQSINVVDAMTVQIKTSIPAPATPDSLSLVPILPKEIATAASEESFAQGKSAIGTGPYKFSEWLRGQRVVLVKNDKYWGGVEPWNKVTFEFLLKEPARASALLSGSVDVISGATAGIVEALGRSDKLDHVSTTSYMLNYIYFDMRPVAQFATDASGKPLSPNPFHNAKVRQAINLAINRDVLAKRVMKGDAVPTGQVVPEGYFGYDPALKPAVSDPARAKTLLAEAGYPQGFNLTIHCTNDRYLNDAKVCEAIGQMLTQVGIKTSVQTVPFAVLQPRLHAAPKPDQEVSMAMWGIGSVFGDSLQPLIAVNMTRDEKRGTGASNYGRYSNPQVDGFLAKANETMSSSEREELQRKAARTIVEESGYLPIQHIKASYAFRKGLTVVPRGDGFIFATNVREAGAK
jgi:peptide/nickel transport system substrate-binding protein